MGYFLLMIVQGVLELMIWMIIASAILSWLIAFNVINTRNSFVYQVLRVLDGITQPVLWPFRKVVPPIGGIDITPVLAIIVLGAAERALVPWIFTPIIAALGG